MILINWIVWTILNFHYINIKRASFSNKEVLLLWKLKLHWKIKKFLLLEMSIATAIIFAKILIFFSVYFLTEQKAREILNFEDSLMVYSCWLESRATVDLSDRLAYCWSDRSTVGHEIVNNCFVIPLLINKSFSRNMTSLVSSLFNSRF